MRRVPIISSTPYVLWPDQFRETEKSLFISAKKPELNPKYSKPKPDQKPNRYLNIRKQVSVSFHQPHANPGRTRRVRTLLPLDHRQVAERRQTSHPSRPNLVASSPTRRQLPLPESEAVIFLL
ncbi:hypothetical protein YC2023_045023 [Brassica napus]